MQCHKCGSALSVTSKFCPGCGTTVEDTYNQSAGGLNSNMVTPRHAAPPLAPPSPHASAAQPAYAQTSDSYFLLLGDQQSGPFTVNQMKAMWQSGNINAGTQYWQTGMISWQPLANIRHFLDLAASSQPGAPIVINQVNQNVAGYPNAARSRRSRGTYVVLGLFFGLLGVHNFYAGYSGRGIAQLLITIFLGWLIIGIFITGLWVLLEVITVSTDAEGLPM